LIYKMNFERDNLPANLLSIIKALHDSCPELKSIEFGDDDIVVNRVISKNNKKRQRHQTQKITHDELKNYVSPVETILEILISPLEETNNDLTYQNSSNDYLNTLLFDLKIQQEKTDEDTWININSRLETVFGRGRKLKTPDDIKYLELIKALENSKFNVYPVGVWIEKANYSFNTGENLNMQVDQSISEIPAENINDKENNQIKKVWNKPWYNVADKLLSPNITEDSLQIRVNDNSIIIDLAKTNGNTNLFDDRKIEFGNNLNTITNGLNN
ncbi:771_t:CDS:2, partial [Racocetra fulgida]